MSNITFKQSNFNRPAPKWWRKLEDGLLMILIPAIVAILMGWGFANEAFANKLILIINTGLVALIKFIGKMLANGEDYVSATEDEGNVLDYPTENDFPATGLFDYWYHTTTNDNYYYWTGRNYDPWVGPRPKDPPKPQ